MYLPYYYGEDSIFLYAMLAVMLLGLIAQSSLRRTFNKYSRISAGAGISAVHTAEALLRQEGSHAIVHKVGGQLTDHFNPKTHMVGLSETVYNSTSVAALAVAAHEIGHVMQYEQGYVPIRIRNAVLPIASIGSQLAPIIVLIGLMMASTQLAMLGVFMFGTFLLFQLVTLPVEFNASRRAMDMLESGGFLAYDESKMAKRVLRAAAMTYVVAALASLATLLRYLALANRRR